MFYHFYCIWVQTEAKKKKKNPHSSLASCYAERCSHHLVTEKQAFVQDQQCVISSGPPVRQRHWAQAAGGHFSGPFRTTVNLQTIYLNKGCCVRRKKRHRKQMNKKHQLPGPDLERPGPSVNFTPNDCRLGLTSLQWRGKPSQGYPPSISWGPGQTGEEKEQEVEGDWEEL